jgi:hypothetical protein
LKHFGEQIFNMNQIVAKENAVAVHDWHALKEQATFAWKSGILPKSTDTPEKAITIALYGRELGLPILTALNGIYILNGMVTIKSALMLRLIYERVRGARITIIESNTDRCTVEMQRPGGDPQRFTVTMVEMNRAGVTGKQVWKSYPDTMLRWAAIRTGARVVFADAIAGVYLEDEAPNHDPKEMEVIEPKLVEPAGSVIQHPTLAAPSQTAGKAASNGTAPAENPSVNGNEVTEAEIAKAMNYVCTWGPLKNEGPLGKQSLDRLIKYADGLRDNAAKTGKMGPQAQELLDMIETLALAHNKAPKEADIEIPF